MANWNRVCSLCFLLSILLYTLFYILLNIKYLVIRYFGCRIIYVKSLLLYIACSSTWACIRCAVEKFHKTHTRKTEPSICFSTNILFLPSSLSVCTNISPLIYKAISSFSPCSYEETKLMFSGPPLIYSCVSRQRESNRLHNFHPELVHNTSTPFSLVK